MNKKRKISKNFFMNSMKCLHDPMKICQASIQRQHNTILVLTSTQCLSNRSWSYEVTKQLKARFIKPVHQAQRIANVVPVPKKDGKVRMCVNFRDLNKAYPKDDFPLPHIDDLVDNTTCACPVLGYGASQVVGLTIYLLKWANEYPTTGSSLGQGSKLKGVAN